VNVMPKRIGTAKTRAAKESRDTNSYESPDASPIEVIAKQACFLLVEKPGDLSQHSI
jgi:hypothetical protein